MITYSSGSIFDSGCDLLINPVNCVGVMGAGLAKEFKDRNPEMFSVYRSECLKGKLVPGCLLVYNADSDHYIIGCLATKDHWKQPSQLAWIKSGIIQLRELRAKIVFKSVAIPAIGCGLGGLPWDQVHNIILNELSGLNFRVVIYPPK